MVEGTEVVVTGKEVEVVAGAWELGVSTPLEAPLVDVASVVLVAGSEVPGWEVTASEVVEVVASETVLDGLVPDGTVVLDEPTAPVPGSPPGPVVAVVLPGLVVVAKLPLGVDVPAPEPGDELPPGDVVLVLPGPVSPGPVSPGSDVSGLVVGTVVLGLLVGDSPPGEWAPGLSPAGEPELGEVLGVVEPGELAPGLSPPGELWPGEPFSGELAPEVVGVVEPGSLEPGSFEPGSFEPGSLLPRPPGDEPAGVVDGVVLGELAPGLPAPGVLPPGDCPPGLPAFGELVPGLPGLPDPGLPLPGAEVGVELPGLPDPGLPDPGLPDPGLPGPEPPGVEVVVEELPGELPPLEVVDGEPDKDSPGGAVVNVPDRVATRPVVPFTAYATAYVVPACRVVRARHSSLAASKRPGTEDLRAGARTATLSSCSPGASMSTIVAGFWSVEPIGGSVVTFRSSAACACELGEAPPSRSALFPPGPFVTR